MKDQAASASRNGTMDLSPPKLFSVPSHLQSFVTDDEDRSSIRNAVKHTCSSSLASAASQTNSRRSSFSSLDHGSPITANWEVITEPKHDSAPPDMTDDGIPGNHVAEFTLPAWAIELDLLDCDAIPALIAGVVRGTNVTEFLERLEVLAYTGTRRTPLDLYSFDLSSRPLSR